MNSSVSCDVQCGTSRVVYIGQIPSGKFNDEAVLKLAEPFGIVRKYFLNRIKREVGNPELRPEEPHEYETVRG